MTPYRRIIVSGSAAIASFGWGISCVAIVAPSKTAFSMLSTMADGQIVYSPMLDYWLRMTAVVFTFVGILFALVAVKPAKWRTLGLMLAFFQICCGFTLLFWALNIGLDKASFQWD